MKLDNFLANINKSASSGIHFGTICSQKTCFKINADHSLLQILGCDHIHQGDMRLGNGEFVIDLNNYYSYDFIILCDQFAIWEGLFIGISTQT